MFLKNLEKLENLKGEVGVSVGCGKIIVKLKNVSNGFNIGIDIENE